MSYEPIQWDGPVGKSIVRRSGRDKVCGTATFTAEWPVDRLLHAVAVPATIARGRVKRIDASRAKAMDGVREILTGDNVPKTRSIPTGNESNFQTSLASHLLPCKEQEIFFAGQYVAAVIADTFEAARDAALAVEVEYEVRPHQTDFDAVQPDERPEQLFGSPPVIEIGDAEAALSNAEVVVDHDYPTAGNQHNPIEPHAAIAHWSEKNGKPFLTIHETSQSLPQTRGTYAKLFGLNPNQVRVVCKFIGGAFGSKGLSWPQTLIACYAAKLTGRPVKIVVTRRQSYGGTGHRTPIAQRLAIGSDRGGNIQSIVHSGHSATASKDTYSEAFTMATRMMYATDHLRLDQKLSRLDTQVPTFMRAPAETPGLFALETAMDELANELGLDPIELRVRNEPNQDIHSEKPFSGRLLTRCLREGADKFGWQTRPERPGDRREGPWKIGYGVASATYPYFTFPVELRLTARADGTFTLASATHEMGTGTVTTQSQLAADLLGVPVGRVSMELGDTDLPPGNLSGGSSTAASVGAAVRDGCDRLKKRLLEMAEQHAGWPAIDPADAKFGNGHLMAGEGVSIPIEDLLREAMKDAVDVRGKFSPNQQKDFSCHSFGAHFVEVGVDEDLGMVRVRRLLGCYGCGTILNARTARSQFIGGMIMGVGHALHEAVHWDHRYGRITNDNLAEYHVPVCADIPDIDVMWIAEPDYNASAVGAKGIGEIGITGVAAAISNAIFNATGKRLRHTPFTPQAVMTPT